MSDTIIDRLADDLADVTAERDAALARAEIAEAEIARLTARVAELSAGISVRGWWCMPCDTFNGEEHSPRTECRHCGKAKTVRT